MNAASAYQKGFSEVTKNVDAWKKFLDFSSQLYKYDYVEKVIFYSQNPNATFLADFDTWNKVGRRIKLGEKSIVGMSQNQDGYSVKHYFDLSQTVGEKFIEPSFSLDKEDATEVTSRFYQKVFHVSKTEVPSIFPLEDIISKGVETYMDHDDSGIVRKFHIFIEDSVLYSLGKKVDWIKENEFSEDTFREITVETWPMIGHVTNEVTKHALLSIGQLQKELSKEKERVKDERTRNNTERRDLDRSNNLEQSSIRPTAGTLRENRNELSVGEQSLIPGTSEVRGDSNGVSTSEGRSGSRTGNQITERTVRQEPIPEYGGSSFNGKPPEKHLEPNTRNRDKPDDREAASGRATSEPVSFQDLKGTTNAELLPESLIKSQINDSFSYPEKGQANPLNNQMEEKEGPSDQHEISLFDEFDDTEAQPNEKMETVSAPITKAADEGSNFFENQLLTHGRTKREKAQQNIEAIKLSLKIELEGRKATKDEQLILSKYSGWGGIQEIFDEQNESWAKERIELTSLLSTNEYSDARASVLTAFFTDPELIGAMYEFLDSRGDFTHAKILDPAMGTGNFFRAMPEKWQNANLKGVELDPVTGRIAQQLYPVADVQIMGYEQTAQNQKFDLIVGNIPFNSIKVTDPKYDKYNFVVHDYFMAKSIDNLNQKGIMMFITSAGSMDKRNSKAREYWAKRANLIGAVRLPKTAFKQSAGTEVISDILIFQKKTYQEMVGQFEEPSWLKSVEHPEYPGLFVNQYFIDHPQNILGDIQVKNFHGQTIDVVPQKDKDLIQEVAKAFTNFGDVQEITISKEVPTKAPEKLESVEVTVPEGTGSFSFFVQGSRAFFHTVDGDYSEYKGTANINRIRDMIPIKAALAELLELQQYSYEESDLQEKLAKLNEVYDHFVSKHGHFNEKANRKILSEDNKYPLLMSLEKETEDGYEKQPIFFKATVRPISMVTSVNSFREAVQFSMTKKRKIDFEYIQSIYPNHTIKDMLEEGKDFLYVNPSKIEKIFLPPEEQLDAWEIKEEFLTGNVKAKYDFAKARENLYRHPDLTREVQKSIDALQTSQPERLLAGEIQFQIGSPWIPKEFYNKFMHDIFETPHFYRSGSNGISIDFLDHNATWRIVRKTLNQNSVVVRQKYGTDRISGYEILEQSLNLKQVTVQDRVEDVNGNARYVLNPKETMIARGKQQDIENAFQQWLFKDRDRMEELVSIYNNRFNTNVLREYDGSELVFDQMNINMELRPHQKNVIARILYSGKALMAHEVGAGKTAAMLSAGMYMKQNGMINKPLYVVPNHLTEQWGQEILSFYPNANVLITTKKDFQKENRQEFVSKIATGDYDAVIIGHSQFERIPLSKERQKETLQTQIREVEDVVRGLKQANAENWTVKQMERFKANLTTTLEKLDNNKKRDDVINFEDLGVDFLFVDEAHIYKNLFIYTKMQNVAGVGSSRSQRASDMLGKVRYIQEEHDGQNVVFATGTPISNSMSEMYVMQYFLQPEELRAKSLNSFDAWAATFGQVTSSLEITPEGSGYRMRNRFSKFHNLPELMGMFNQVADIQTADMLDLPTPKLAKGKVQTIIANRSDFQDEMMDQFVIRSEKIRNGMVDPTEDNMLKLTHEAKMMAIDSRLIDASQPRDPESKLSLCAENVFSIWEATKEERLTQIIFSDSGTPKPDQFNVYDEIREQLIAKGVPKDEVAFIHEAKTDAQRDALFEKVRKGSVRVIIGSTQKLGTGTNIQDKLVAAHHVDCPWKPSDNTQREGRILRQGNQNEEVSIFRYITKGTFDSYLWQIQEQKLTYISQVMTGTNVSRSMDDLDETVLTAAEVKAVATDNPLLEKKMSVDNEVTRLQIMKAQWENTRSRMDKNVREVYPNKIAYHNGQIEKYEKDMAVINSNPIDEFQMEIEGNIITDRREAFDLINSKVTLNPSNDQSEIPIGQFRGLEVVISHTGLAEDVILLKGEGTYRTRFTPETGIGNIARIMHLPSYIEGLREDERGEIEDVETQIKSAEKELETDFPQQKELDQFLKEQNQINSEIEFGKTKEEVVEYEEELGL